MALVGVGTYATSLSTRSKSSTPVSIRRALDRYSTWSYDLGRDLADAVGLDDLGDVPDPDGPDGMRRVGAALARRAPGAPIIILGGDNAATWLALTALTGEALADYGLITLDAHLDVREGRSNGSPVRQLLESGLRGERVVQVGLADFANSPAYARYAAARGVTALTRSAFRESGPEELAERALAIAGAGGAPIYVDLDFDACDRAIVPGCPAAAPGGLSADELRRFARALARDERVVAVDITEIDVARDVNETTIRLGALVVLDLLAGVSER